MLGNVSVVSELAAGAASKKRPALIPGIRGKPARPIATAGTSRFGQSAKRWASGEGLEHIVFGHSYPRSASFRRHSFSTVGPSFRSCVRRNPFGSMPFGA